MTSVVITGPPGAGKTTLSHLVGSDLGIPHVNIGDAIALRLLECDVVVRERAELGSAFLQRFGIKGYEDLLLRCAERNPCVLDGVRLASAVETLRREASIVHVHRTRSMTLATRLGEDGFANEIPKLSGLAQYHIPWFRDERALERWTRASLIPALQIRLAEGLQTPHPDSAPGEASGAKFGNGTRYPSY